MPRKLLSRSGALVAKLNATVQQTNFLGGEASPAAQGRSDDPRYKTWLSAYKNAYPTEQGAWTRRDGSMAIIPTRNRNYAKLHSSEMGGQLPYILEFTDGSLRLYYGTTPTMSGSFPITAAVSSSGQLTLTTSAAHSWSVGDDVMLWFAADKPQADEGNYRGRVLQCMSGTTGSTLVLGDENGNATIGNNITLDGSELVFRIQRLSTVINSTNYPTTINTVLQQLRFVQVDTSGLIVQGNLPPQQLTIATPAAGINDAQFAISAATFQDGPYASMVVDTGTVSALSGNAVTFTPRAGTYTFTADDVGKQIRLFSEPANWASGTTYASGALIKYNGAYYQSTQGSNTGNTPGSPNVVSGVLTQWWVAVLNVQRWVWGTVQSQTGTACVLNFGADLSNLNGLPVGATNAIPSGNGTSSITSWQLGLWSKVNGYPINGCFHEGRLLLFGPVGNRWDASVSNAILTFSPTDQYGNVNDNSALSETLNSADVLFWGRPDDRGVIVGAQRGEWLISGGAEGDPLTPTNTKARRVTKYRCAAIEPVEMGSSLIFAQFFKKHLFEYLIDSFSNRFQGKPLNEIDMPITNGNIAELAATLEPTPRCWVRNADGSLVSCTYRRISRFITEAPIFDAMNPHSIGDGRIVETLVGASNPGAGDAACTSLKDPSLPLPDATSTGDYLYLVTNDAPDPATSGSANNRMVEVIRPQVEADDFALSWYADQSPGQGKHLLGNTVSLGAVRCTPIGGLKGSDNQTSEPADIGTRATATPGSTIPNSGTSRQAALAILNNGVWFDGNSSLFNLPRVKNSSSGLTLSCWLNLAASDDGEPNSSESSAFFYGSNLPCGQGAILAAPAVFLHNTTTPSGQMPAPSNGGLPAPIYITTGLISGPTTSTTYDPANNFVIKIVGPAFDTSGNLWLSAGQVRWAKMIVQDPKYVTVPGRTDSTFRGAAIAPLITGDGLNPGVYPITQNLSGTGAVYFGDGGISNFSVRYPYGIATNGGSSDIPADPPLLANNHGWYHLMISIRPYVAGTADPLGTGWGYQVYVNDTQIINTTDGNIWFPMWTKPSSLPLADLAGWYIGGRMPCTPPALISLGSTDVTSVTQQDGAHPDDASGLVAAMTELWIAPTGIDLTVGANRQKFHTTDVGGTTYSPVDLGARGQTPTGSKPWIYCTGTPDVFHLNRAAKNAPLAVWCPNNDVSHVQGTSETRFLFAWLGEPVT